MKMATGAGKTTVMAMLIAWQVINARRSTGSKLFTTGFLIVAPGITIRDRLRVLLPSDPDSYHKTRELMPADMLVILAAQRSSLPTITHFNSARQTTRTRSTEVCGRVAARRSRRPRPKRR